MQIKKQKRKWLTITISFVYVVLLSAVTIWVAHSLIYSNSYLTNRNFVTENEIKESFVLKGGMNTSNIYEIDKSNNEAKLIQVNDKYINREFLRDANVFEREGIADNMILVKKDDSYLKKENYNDSIFYQVDGEGNNLTLVPSKENNFISKNTYLDSILYAPTGDGTSGILTPVDINKYLRKSDYLNSTLFRRTGTGNDTTMTPIDISVYSAVNVKFQCLKPDFWGYYLEIPKKSNNQNEIKTPTTSESNFIGGLIIDGNKRITVYITPSQSYIYENINDSGFDNLSKNKEQYYKLEKGESKDFFIVGKAVTEDQDLQSSYNNYLGAFKVTVTRNNDGLVSASNHSFTLSRSNSEYENPSSFINVSYSNVSNNVLNKDQWTGLVAPSAKSEWTSNCYYTHEKV